MPRLEGLEHRLLGRVGARAATRTSSWPALQEGRRGELHRRAMARCALGDRGAEARDPVARLPGALSRSSSSAISAWRSRSAWYRLTSSTMIASLDSKW